MSHARPAASLLVYTEPRRVSFWECAHAWCIVTPESSQLAFPNAGDDIVRSSTSAIMAAISRISPAVDSDVRIVFEHKTHSTGVWRIVSRPLCVLANSQLPVHFQIIWACRQQPCRAVGSVTLAHGSLDLHISLPLFCRDATFRRQAKLTLAAMQVGINAVEIGWNVLPSWFHSSVPNFASAVVASTLHDCILVQPAVRLVPAFAAAKKPVTMLFFAGIGQPTALLLKLAEFKRLMRAVQTHIDVYVVEMSRWSGDCDQILQQLSLGVLDLFKSVEVDSQNLILCGYSMGSILVQSCMRSESFSASSCVRGVILFSPISDCVRHLSSTRQQIEDSDTWAFVIGSTSIMYSLASAETRILLPPRTFADLVCQTRIIRDMLTSQSDTTRLFVQTCRAGDVPVHVFAHTQDSLVDAQHSKAFEDVYYLTRDVRGDCLNHAVLYDVNVATECSRAVEAIVDRLSTGGMRASSVKMTLRARVMAGAVSRVNASDGCRIYDQIDATTRSASEVCSRSTIQGIVDLMKVMALGI